MLPSPLCACCPRRLKQCQDAALAAVRMLSSPLCACCPRSCVHAALAAVHMLPSPLCACRLRWLRQVRCPWACAKEGGGAVGCIADGTELRRVRPAAAESAHQLGACALQGEARGGISAAARALQRAHRGVKRLGCG
eukprot:356768-Chlamydomonas_euryale.AAC.2